MARIKFIENENDVKKLIKDAFDKINAWSYAPIQTGMGVHGIPDRIACVPITVTQAMVGKTLGIFVAVEAKAPGRRGQKNAGATGQQVNVLNEILDAYGLALLADGEEDAAFLKRVIKMIDTGDVTAVQLRALLNHRTGKTNG